MATVTDRASAKTVPTRGAPRVGAIRVQLGTRTEAITAGNFGFKTLYQVLSTGVAIGGSTGTILTVVVRNPGSEGARASVTAVRLAANGNGSVTFHRIIAGTVSGEFLGVGL